MMSTLFIAAGALLVVGVVIWLVVNRFRFEAELDELRTDLSTLRQRLTLPPGSSCPLCGMKGREKTR
jgi:uncharacterized membrane-anchored protein YhcB (DUF1043 family)